MHTTKTNSGRQSKPTHSDGPNLSLGHTAGATRQWSACRHSNNPHPAADSLFGTNLSLGHTAGATGQRSARKHSDDPHLAADSLFGTNLSLGYTARATRQWNAHKYSDDPHLAADSLFGTNPSLGHMAGATGQRSARKHSDDPHPEAHAIRVHANTWTVPERESTNSNSDDNTDNGKPTNSNPRHNITQSDSEESVADNNTYHHPQQLTHPIPTHPNGSLLHCFPCPRSNPDDDAEHILLWLDIMEGGPTAFEREITRNLRHTNIAPALFAILPEWSETIKLAHGFMSMLLTNGQHWADGQVGFFLGNRIAVPLTTGN